MTSSLQFSKTVRMRCGPQRLIQGWTSMSELDCAIWCIEKFGNTCTCFMYNEVTNLCTHCKGISTYSTPPSKQEGDLFFINTSDSYPDSMFSNSCKCFMYNKLSNLCTPCAGISAMPNPPSNPEGDLYFDETCDGYPDFRVEHFLQLHREFIVLLIAKHFLRFGNTCKCLLYNKSTKFCTPYAGISPLSDPPSNREGDVFFMETCSGYPDFRYGNSSHCFMYNKTTNLCTPCAGIDATSSTPIIQEGDLYFIESCNGYPDFRWYSLPLIPLFPKVYAAYFRQFLNYTETTSVCECLESNMFSPKYPDKLTYFLNITDLQSYDWVGLDDIKNEGKFVWAEDGTEIDDVQKLAIFALGQPDNGGSNEDCVHKLPYGMGIVIPGKFNDANCVLAQCLIYTLHDIVSFQFTKTVRLKCGPQRLDSGWTSRSELDCAVACKDKFGSSCKCFMYNNHSGFCTPCSGITANSPSPSFQDGDLFFTDSCEGYPDFRYYSQPPLPTIYAARFDKYLNYTDAASVCKCLESNLFSPKTFEKFDLFLNIAGLQSFDWIGLDDIHTEGKFVWAEDGTEISVAQKLAIFSPGQPDNGWGSDEDCVYKWALGYGTPGKLNDVNCSHLARFVCEKPQC
ncbi:hypothetical protein Btru_049947 [Bulinus truncatus]|nr:hypothetical protein Btru_049947 [Bulinus truncatus]